MDTAEEMQNGGDYVTVKNEAGVDEEKEKVHEEGVNNVDDDSANDTRHHHDDRGSSQGKIFIGGVSWETTEEIFTKHFEKYGEIVDSVIMKEKHTRRPRGFGFITFSDPSVLDKVLEDEHVINGRTVEVKRTVPKEEMEVKGGSQKTKKIFVGGIPPSITDEELKEYFSSYGNILEHQIMLDHSSGRSRGFGFVTFESENVVDEIINEGKTHELGGKQVEIKKAEPKRGGGDHGGDTRDRYGGGFPSSYGDGGAAYGFSGGSRSGGGYGAGGGYGGRPAKGYGGYGAGATGPYDGYGGGYGYRGGYGGPMYGNGEYGYVSRGGYGGAYGGGYGGAYGGGYGGGYGAAGGFGGGYGAAAAGGYGAGGAAAAGGYGAAAAAAAGGYGPGGGHSGGGRGSYGSGGAGGKGYGSAGAAWGRYHPYGK